MIVETLTLKEKENITATEGEGVNGDQKPEIPGKRRKKHRRLKVTLC